MDIISNAGGAGGFSFENSPNSYHLPPTGRGRVRSDSFGLPERAGLIDLARTYLDAQARQSFFCFNATSGVKGCTNRGYKSARIIDEAVLGAVMATLFTEEFIADLTADVNARLAELARQPISSTKKLEQEIVNEDRQLKRLTDRLDKIDGTHLDAVIAKAEEMGRQLAAKRERLKELQRAGRRPKVKSVREQDVVALLSHLRDLLRGDVAMAAQVLKALVGDVVISLEYDRRAAARRAAGIRDGAP